MKKKIDITDLFETYRECVRHNWNAYFRVLQDGWHEFINVERGLFHGLILVQVQEEYDFYKENTKYIDSFKIELKQYNQKIDVMLAKEEDGKIWNWKVFKYAENEIDCRYIDFFDWNQDGFRNFQFIRGRVLRDEVNGFKNYDALFEFDNINVYFETEQ